MNNVYRLCGEKASRGPVLPERSPEPLQDLVRSLNVPAFVFLSGAASGHRRHDEPQGRAGAAEHVRPSTRVFPLASFSGFVSGVTPLTPPDVRL